MRKMLNWRTGALVGWIVITLLLLLTMPNLDQLVREKGQIDVPDSAQSEAATKMLSQMNQESGDNYDIITVYSSSSGAPLSDAQLEEIAAVIEQFKINQDELGITKLLTHLDSEQTAKQLMSEDGTTILTQISISMSSGTVTEVSERLNAMLDMESVEAYLTGAALVTEDFVISTQEGIKKTEIIAVIFILIVLVLVFRSPIVPFVSLLTVGVSYLVSLGIVAQLVDQWNYPFSNFTQIFLVVILFGIGTDYNILLYTRFKEELSRTEHVLDAIKATYKSAGKTVLYSGVAVLIGFLTLLLAEFKFYQSTSAVAIAVAVLIAVLNTLNPFFMALLGKRMFWPIKRFEGHGDNRMWAWLSRVSVKRPFLFLLIALLLCVPVYLNYSGTLSYNTLLEVDDSYRSKQGINVIEEHFPAGFSSPASVVIQSDRAMNNSETLKLVDELADKIEHVDGVASVYTITRPEGKRIDELYINDQTRTLYSGLQDAADGIGQIKDGLGSAEDKLSSSTSSTAGIEQLIDGTRQAQDGAAAIGSVLEQLSAGLVSGEAGAGELQSGLHTVNEKLEELAHATSQLHAGYSQLSSGLGSFSSSFRTIAAAIDGARAGYEQIETAMSAFAEQHPELASDQHVQLTLGVAAAAKQQLAALSAELAQLTPAYSDAIAKFEQANGSLQQINSGITMMKQGVSQLETGASSLQTGLQEASSGSSQLAGKSMELAAGIGKVNAGQEQLLGGLAGLQDQMNVLRAGLEESTNGLQQVNDGLHEAQDYLVNLSASNASSIFYIPQDVLEGEAFQEAVGMYMSDDHRTVRMMVILDVNPYSSEAMEIVKDMNDQVRAAVQGTELSDAEIAIGGMSAQNADLRDIASGDFTRTATIMLIGIGIVLMVITRSFWQPIFIIASLLIAYGTALGVTELAAVKLLGVDSLGWNVPFFGFIMIVALGVDYSIFLMMRYRELPQEPVNAIIEAAKHIGGVVISAAVILGGTFAALIPSGVLSLIEIAILVIVGLAALSFVMLPVFIPALISITSKLSGQASKE